MRLNIRMDAETMIDLELLCKVNRTTKTEVVRRLILAEANTARVTSEAMRMNKARAERVERLASRLIPKTPTPYGATPGTKYVPKPKEPIPGEDYSDITLEEQERAYEEYMAKVNGGIKIHDGPIRSPTMAWFPKEGEDELQAVRCEWCQTWRDDLWVSCYGCGGGRLKANKYIVSKEWVERIASGKVVRL